VLKQHWFWTQAAHADPAALKIWAAPGQLPASVNVWTGGVPASVPASRRGGVVMPPPGVAPLHVATPLGVQFPSAGGLPSGREGDEDEQAKKAVMAPASDA
jgi:hypothetical protein